MTGLISMLLRTVWWQKVDFPEPGGPTKRIMFFGGTSCIWVRYATKYHLPELPLTVRITHRNTLSFFDVLVFDGVEEPVKEASGEIA